MAKSEPSSPLPKKLLKLLAESPLVDLELEHPPFSGPVRDEDL
jgi:hypothetical protein